MVWSQAEGRRVTSRRASERRRLGERSAVLSEVPGVAVEIVGHGCASRRAGPSEKGFPISGRKGSDGPEECMGKKSEQRFDLLHR